MNTKIREILNGKAVLLLWAILCVFIANAGFAQGTAINTTGNPSDPSAMLDISSTSKGLLVPRLTTAQVNAIVNPADGLMIFNITTGCFNYYFSGAWLQWCGTCPTLTTVSNSPVCAGNTVTLNASTIPGATYSWTGPNGFTSTLQNPSITNATVAATGTYNCSAVVGSCSALASVSVTVNSVPSSSFTFLPSSPNNGQSVTFTPSALGGTVSYSWTFTGGTPATSTLQSPSVVWSSAGTYDASLTTSQSGCTSAVTTNPVTVAFCAGGSVTFNANSGSVQTWSIPSCVNTITITAYGAQGGNADYGTPYNTYSTGGNGAKIEGTFSVTGGTQLSVVVGKQGTSSYNTQTGGGGGGGSFVWQTSGSTLLIAAGGGGGAAIQCASGCSGSGNGWNNGAYASATQTPNSCPPSGTGGAGGTSGGGGGGGTGHTQTFDLPGAGGGAGWVGDGSNGGAGNCGVGGEGGKRPLNGANGGAAGGCNGAIGGYGGGGGGAGIAGGGGGGYNGGGGGTGLWGSSGVVSSGGGGGSYNGGSNQTNTANVQSGDGWVTISY